MIVPAQELLNRSRATQSARYLVNRHPFEPVRRGQFSPSHRLIMFNGSQTPAAHLSGTYYAVDGVGSIFSKIGHAVASVAKGIVKVAGKVLPIALPVAVGAIGLRIAAPVIGKVAGSIFRRAVQPGVPQVTPAPSTPISLPDVTTQVVMPTPVATSAPMVPAPSQVLVPGATDQTQPNAGATVQAATPPWLWPAVIGGGVLLFLVARK